MGRPCAGLNAVVQRNCRERKLFGRVLAGNKARRKLYLQVILRDVRAGRGLPDISRMRRVCRALRANHG